MRTALACLLSTFALTAHATPVFDDQRGQARDAFRDLTGVDLTETTGVTNDSGLVRLATPNTVGSLLTQRYEPLSARAWKKVYLTFTAAARDDVQLAVHAASGAFIANLPLVPTSQAGFTAEADLSTIALSTHPALRFRVTLDGVGAAFPPTLDELLVTWQPVSRLDVSANVASAVCSGDTFTVDVPLSVSFVRAEGLVVALDAPIASDHTHPVPALDVVSASVAGATGRTSATTRVYDQLRVDAGEVYWAFPAPVAAGTSLVLSVTYRVPAGIDHGTRFTTRAHADATNADLVSSAPVAIATNATATAQVLMSYTSSYTEGTIHFAEQGETITAHVHVDNTHVPTCGQVMHDVVVVDRLDRFVGPALALAPPPFDISDGGSYVAVGQTRSFSGHSVTGPAVVWTVPTIAPQTFVERSYRMTLDAKPPAGQLVDGATPVRAATAISMFDGTTANAERSITVGLPDQPYGLFAIGQKVGGAREVNAVRDDQPNLVVATGSPFSFVLYADNRGLSRLEDVVIAMAIPDGLDYLAATLPAHAELYFNDAISPPATPPDTVGAHLGPTWQLDPDDLAGPVRWVAVRADLASPFFDSANPHDVLAEIDVVEAAATTTCQSRFYDGVGVFTVGSYWPVGATTPEAYGGDAFVDHEPVITAPVQPQIQYFDVARDLAQRVGTGPVTYTFHVANDASQFQSVDVARDVVLAIDLPRVQLGAGPAYLPLASFDPRDGAADYSQLAAGKLFVRWPLLAARSQRDVRLVLTWPAGGVDGDSAELRANLVFNDELCAPTTASDAATTTLVVRPTLSVDKVVDLDVATPGTVLTYTLSTNNSGDGAATSTVVFDRLPLGTRLVRIHDPGLGGRVYVSSAQPPTLPAGYTNLALLDRGLVDRHFVPATHQANGTWTSPVSDVTWIAIDFDDHALSPARLPVGVAATARVEVEVGPLLPDTVINNRAAIDATSVSAAVSRVARTVIGTSPSPRVSRDTPAVVTSGEVFDYRVTTTSAGTVTATSFVLVDTIPAGFTYVGSTFTWNAESPGRPPVTPNVVGQVITWDLGSGVGPRQGGSAVVTLRADDALATGDVRQILSVATIANANVPSGVSANASSIVRIATADVTPTITIDRDDPVSGDRVTATLTFANLGEHVADDSKLRLRLPPGLTFVTGSDALTTAGYTLSPRTGTASDMSWTFTRTGAPTDQTPAQSGPIAIRVQLDVGTVPAGTSLPIEVIASTSTGQGGATSNDRATTNAVVPYPDPYVTLDAPTVVRPGDPATLVVRYGNATRQASGPTTIVVTVPHAPHDNDLTTTLVRVTPHADETLYYYSGTAGADLTLPANPLANGWTTSPVPGTSHFAMVTSGLAANATRQVEAQVRFISPLGELVDPGSEHGSCAVLRAPDDSNLDNNEACRDIAVPGVNLTAALTSTPSGAAPGVAVGDPVTHVATLTNTGYAASFGNWLTLDRPGLVDTTTLPSAITLTVLDATGVVITRPIPLTRDGTRWLIGTKGGASDPLDYRNIALRPGDHVDVTFTGTTSPTNTKTNLVATLVVGTDYAHGYDPDNAEPEPTHDNSATTSVVVYRPDLTVAMTADVATASNGERIAWQVSYDNLGDIGARNATLTSTVAGGTRFVIGSVRDVPPGFVVEYLGPTTWGYQPSGANGQVDPNVRAVRLVGGSLGAPLNPTYSASPAALANANGGTRYVDGHVVASATGDTWTSEVVGLEGGGAEQWTRVQLGGRGGDDPLLVTVLDGVTGTPIPGYSDLPSDSSGAIDISGVDAAVHESLQFKVSFEGTSAVCDLTSGLSVAIDGGAGVTAITTTRTDISGVADLGTTSYMTRDYQSVAYPAVGPWTATQMYVPGDALAMSDTLVLRAYANYEWWVGSYVTTLAVTDPNGSPLATITPPEWLRRPYYTADHDWMTRGATTFTTRFSEVGGALYATTLVPGPDVPREPLPYVFSYAAGVAKLEALPVPDPAQRVDFDGQGRGASDVVFGREQGELGRPVFWEDLGGWAGYAIGRPVEATGEVHLRTDGRSACFDFETATGHSAYRMDAYGNLDAIGEGQCQAAFGEVLVVSNAAGLLVYDGGVTALAGSAGYTIIDRGGGWLLGTNGTTTKVWTGTADIDVATNVTAIGIDAAHVVYAYAPGLVAIPITNGAAGAMVPMTLPGWGPLSEVRAVGDGVFVGLASVDGGVQGAVRLRYDAATGVSGESQAGMSRPDEPAVRHTVGAWAVGHIYDASYVQDAALWAPDGGGPEGWGVTVLPRLPGAEGINHSALGMDHADPSVIVGQVGYSQIVTWTKSVDGWDVHVVANDSLQNQQGAHSAYNNELTQATLKTNNGGHVYFDPTSVTGVRYMMVPSYETFPPLFSSSTDGMFSLQAETGVPLLVTTGTDDYVSAGPLAWYFEGDELRVQRLPGFNSTPNHVHPTRPIVVGYSYVDDVQRAAVWTRDDGVWTRELIGNPGAYAVLVMGDGSVYGVDASDNYRSNIYQKRNGVWVAFPLPRNVNINWQDQRVASTDGLLYGIQNDDAMGRLTVWRAPRPDEDAVTTIEIGAQGYSDGVVYDYRSYLDDGVLLGVRNVAGAPHIVSWRVQPDDTIVEVDEDPGRLGARWNDTNSYMHRAGMRTRSVYLGNDYSGSMLWVVGEGTAPGTIVDTFPAGYTGSKSNIVPNPDGDLLAYGSWNQRRLYGCGVTSDATFATFAVGYRTGDSPSYGFTTEVDVDVCQATLDATSHVSTSDLETRLDNNAAAASVAFDHAELTVTLTTSHAVAPVGTGVSYHVTIHNAGPAPASGAYVFTGPDGSVQRDTIAVGVGQDVAFDVLATLPDVAVGTVVGAAVTLDGDLPDCDPDDDTATVSTVVADLPNAWIHIASPAVATIGQPFAIDVRYGNDSAVVIPSGAVTVTLPAGLSFVAGDGTLALTPLAPGEARSTTMLVIADASTSPDVVFEGEVDVPDDLIDADDYDTTTTRFIDDRGVLDVAVYADHGSVAAGQRVGFAVLFDNIGQSDATDVVVRVDLPVGTTLVPASTTGSYDAGSHSLSWSIAELAPAAHGGVGFALLAGPDAFVVNASISSPGTTGATHAASVDVIAQDVRVVASVDQLEGDAAIDWVVLLTNDSATTTTVHPANAVPSGTSYLAGSISGPGATEGDPLTWTVTLTPGESQLLHFATTAAHTTNIVDGVVSNITPTRNHPTDLPRLRTTHAAERVEVGAANQVTIHYSNPGPPLIGATLRQYVGAPLQVANAGSATSTGSVLTWDLGDLPTGASGSVTFTMIATSAGPFVLDRAALTSDGIPQVSNDLVGVAIATSGCGDAAETCNGLDDDCDGQTDEGYVSETVTCGVDACATGNGTTRCVDGAVVDDCDDVFADIPDTTCGVGTTGLNVAYIVVTNPAGRAIGSLRCFQDLAATNTPVACDTEADGRTLKVYPELLCEGVQ